MYACVSVPTRKIVNEQGNIFYQILQEDKFIFAVNMNYLIKQSYLLIFKFTNIPAEKRINR